MQMRIFDDSKTFVDMKLKQSPEVTIASFNNFMEKYNNTQPPRNEIKAWLDDNFDGTGTEMIKCYPTDFTQNPNVLKRIKDKDLRKFALDLNNIWIELCRKMKDEVKVCF